MLQCSVLMRYWYVLTCCNVSELVQVRVAGKQGSTFRNGMIMQALKKVLITDPLNVMR